MLPSVVDGRLSMILVMSSRMRNTITDPTCVPVLDELAEADFLPSFDWLGNAFSKRCTIAGKWSMPSLNIMRSKQGE